MTDICANVPDMATGNALIRANVNITSPIVVDVIVNEVNRVVMINVNGLCVLRVTRIENLVLKHIKKGQQEAPSEVFRSADAQ